MKRYTHEQTEPATLWAVEHGLKTRTPILEFYIAVDGVVQRLQPKSVKMIDLDTIHVEWSVPRVGKVGVV